MKRRANGRQRERRPRSRRAPRIQRRVAMVEGRLARTLRRVRRDADRLRANAAPDREAIVTLLLAIAESALLACSALVLASGWLRVVESFDPRGERP